MMEQRKLQEAEAEQYNEQPDSDLEEDLQEDADDKEVSA